MNAELTLKLVLNQIGPGFSEANARAFVEPGPEASTLRDPDLGQAASGVEGIDRQGRSICPLRLDGNITRVENYKANARGPAPNRGMRGQGESSLPDKIGTHSLERRPD